MTKTDTSREAVERLATWLESGNPEADPSEGAAHLRALLTERDALQARAERAEAGLARIAEMKPHHAGQTPNEYHMQKIARATLTERDAEPAGDDEATGD